MPACAWLALPPRPGAGRCRMEYASCFRCVYPHDEEEPLGDEAPLETCDCGCGTCYNYTELEEAFDC
ncbi:Protein of unknown function [Gryllus bimaculatus]|nr:Protein of unknown function [Gryllus bimaculatus]